VNAWVEEERTGDEKAREIEKDCHAKEAGGFVQVKTCRAKRQHVRHKYGKNADAAPSIQNRQTGHTPWAIADLVRRCQDDGSWVISMGRQTLERALILYVSVYG
jgi:hypothetical protein